MTKNDRQEIERLIYIAEQGLKLRIAGQVRAALQGIRLKVANRG